VPAALLVAVKRGASCHYLLHWWACCTCGATTDKDSAYCTGHALPILPCCACWPAAACSPYANLVWGKPPADGSYGVVSSQDVKAAKEAAAVSK
jgi:hypothetical protein